MTITFCKNCESAFEDEESDAEASNSFCGKSCEELSKSFDDFPNLCQQCFNGYDGEVGDGFCSDACYKRYEAQLAGTAEDEGR